MQLAKREQLGRIGFSLLLLWFFYAMISHAGVFSAAVQNSISVCVNQIIPSLYAFLLCSTLLLRSNLHRLLGKPLRLPARIFFGMSGEELVLFAVSQFAGYPVGVQLLSELVTTGQLSATRARRLSYFCFAGGPPFLISLVGISLFGSVRIGLLLFCSGLLANGLLAVFLRLPQQRGVTTPAASVRFHTSDLVAAAEIAAKSMYHICVLIILFGILLRGIELLRFPDLLVQIGTKLGITQEYLLPAYRSCMEISHTAGFPPGCFRTLPLLSALFSFGGICIHLQVAMLGNSWFSSSRFFLARICAAILSATVCRLLLPSWLAGESIPVLAGGFHTQQANASILSILLILMTYIILFKRD